MDIFEIASRKKFTYPSVVGMLTTEQLWDLPLTATKSSTSPHRLDLDSVARAVNADLKSVTEESFVAVRPNPAKADLETKLEVVKHIIAVKQDERAKADAAADRADKRRKLAEALASKQDQALAAMSEEEIRKQLDELDAA
jgi:hypothetical protein